MNLAIYHNLPSGGGKRALFEMTRRLATRHQVDVYTLSTAEHDFCDLRPFVRRYIVFPFRPLPLARRPFGRLNRGLRSLDIIRLQRLQRYIAQKIDECGYDVAFVHQCQISQGPALLQFLQTPSIYYCQEPLRAIYEPRIPRPYNQLSRLQRLGNLVDPLPLVERSVLARSDRRSVRSANLVLVNSAYSLESLYRVYGIHARVCYLGVDTERFRPLGIPRREFVLSVGALASYKGFDFLIRSLAHIAADHRPPLYVVANSPEQNSEHRYLATLAEQLGVSLSIFTHISDDDLVRLYNQARLVLYAPIMEPFGFTAIEAMACGTPVIGVREGGVRETVVDGLTGYLTERDEQLFAEATETLLGDADRVAEMARNGRVWVCERWTWDRTLTQLEKHLAAVTQQGLSSRR